MNTDTISSITDRVLPEIKACKSRSLDSVYPIVWMDAIHYEVTDKRGYTVTFKVYRLKEKGYAIGIAFSNIIKC